MLPRTEALAFIKFDIGMRVVEAPGLVQSRGAAESACNAIVEATSRWGRRSALRPEANFGFRPNAVARDVR